jgi:hypothetical protein
VLAAAAGELVVAAAERLEDEKAAVVLSTHDPRWPTPRTALAGHVDAACSAMRHQGSQQLAETAHKGGYKM